MVSFGGTENGFGQVGHIGPPAQYFYNLSTYALTLWGPWWRVLFGDSRGGLVAG